MAEILKNWLINQGVAEGLAGYVGWLGVALGVIILAFLSNYIAKRFLLAGVRYLVKKSRTKWDDALLEHKVFTRLSHLAPALVIYFSAYLFPSIQEPLQRFSVVYMIFAELFVFNAFLSAAVDIYRTFDVSRQRPIKGYIQIAKIVVSVFVGIIAIALIMGQKPWLLLSGFGAMTAVLLLVFKDSILGLVASVQLSRYHKCFISCSTMTR